MAGSEASDCRMFMFVDHHGMNPVAPPSSAPIKLQTSHNYSKVGGGRGRGRAKLLVWLNTEDLESATLI